MVPKLNVYNIICDAVTMANDNAHIILSKYVPYD